MDSCEISEVGINVTWKYINWLTAILNQTHCFLTLHICDKALRWDETEKDTCSNSVLGVLGRRKVDDGSRKGEKWKTASLGHMLGKRNPICQGDENHS